VWPELRAALFAAAPSASIIADKQQENPPEIEFSGGRSADLFGCRNEYTFE
jgi:hypothetical protein